MEGATKPIIVRATLASKAYIVQAFQDAKYWMEKREYIEKLKPIAVRVKDRVRKIRERLSLTLNANNPNKKNAIRVEFA